MTIERLVSIPVVYDDMTAVPITDTRGINDDAGLGRDNKRKSRVGDVERHVVPDWILGNVSRGRPNEAG